MVGKLVSSISTATKTSTTTRCEPFFSSIVGFNDDNGHHKKYVKILIETYDRCFISSIVVVTFLPFENEGLRDGDCPPQCIESYFQQQQLQQQQQQQQQQQNYGSIQSESVNQNVAISSANHFQSQRSPTRAPAQYRPIIAAYHPR